MQPYEQPDVGGSNTDNNEIKQIANIGNIGLGGNMNANDLEKGNIYSIVRAFDYRLHLLHSDKK
jgi:hypothetical protein